MAKLLVDPVKPNAEFVSPARNYTDRTLRFFSNRKHERTRDYPSPARKGFIFHTPFVSADSDLIGAAFLDEVHVCALWRKRFVMANGRAFPRHIHLADLSDGNN